MNITIRLAIKYTYEATKKTYNNINVYKDTINVIELNVKWSYIYPLTPLSTAMATH